MTSDDVFDFLDDNGNKKLRIFFTDGSNIDCKFDGYSYDYDDDDNEILELTFKALTNGIYFGATPSEIEKIEPF